MHNIMKPGYWDASSVLIPGIREKGGCRRLVHSAEANGIMQILAV